MDKVSAFSSKVCMRELHACGDTHKFTHKHTHTHNHAHTHTHLPHFRLGSLHSCEDLHCLKDILGSTWTSFPVLEVVLL